MCLWPSGFFSFFFHFFVLFRFSSFFFVFLRFSSLFFHSARGQGRTTAIYCKNGEFHSDPVCTDPVRNFLILGLAWHYLAVSQRPLTLMLLQSIAMQMGGVSWYKLVLYILLSAKRRAYFCKTIAIEMGGVSPYFSEVLGSGVDLTLLNYCENNSLESCEAAGP